MPRALRILVLALGAALAASPLEGQGVLAPAAPSQPRGWIGVSYDVLTTQDGAGLRTVSQVVGVMDGSPAAGAGIRPGDILVSINGKDWEEYFDKGTPSLRPGDAVRLVVERGGRRSELRLTAGTRPGEGVPAESFTVTVVPDSIVERLYLAMDSLRVRITVDQGLRHRIAEIQMAADSLVRDLGRDQVVRLRRARPEPALGVAPWDAPVPGQVAGVTAPAGAPFPFGYHVFRSAAGDSVRVFAERGVPFTWSGPEGRPEVVEFRPTVPYVLGENRAAGAEVVELRPELAEYFGVDGGVLVVDVTGGTPAARAGIQPGDVLTRVGSTPVASIADLRRALARPNQADPISLVRKGRTLQVHLAR